MKAINKLLVVISILIFGANSEAQEVKGYIVLTFEKEKVVHRNSETESFLWIVPVDSIYKRGYQLYPIYLTDYSYSDLVKCSKNDTINPYLINDQTNYDFTFDYKNQIELLKKIIIENRKKIQLIKKQWNKKYYEIVTVYATPIRGIFNSCEMESFNYIDYEGLIYLPSSKYSYYDDFWNLPSAKNVEYTDFSFFFFINNATGGSLKDLPRWGIVDP